MGYDALDRLTSWLVTKHADGSTVHHYCYQFDGVGNRTQIVADPTAGVAHSNGSDLAFTAAAEISTIQT